MKNKIYIIPGFGESCREARYKALAKILQVKGYNVLPVSPDWYKPFSKAVFQPSKNAILIGFSFGAVIAYLVAKKYKCQKIILASLSPIHTFSYASLVKDYAEHMEQNQSQKNAKDIKKIKINLKKLETPFVTLAGKREKMNADILVPRTGHYMTKTYIASISKLL